MSQFESWEDFINQLEDKEACDTELKKVKECGSFENFFKHENISFWLEWIITNELFRPWPEAESIILTNAWLSYRYARHVLKRPWPESEPAILTNAWFSCVYARDVLKRPWPEAEPIIMKDYGSWMYYSAWKGGIK